MLSFVKIEIQFQLFFFLFIFFNKRTFRGNNRKTSTKHPKYVYFVFTFACTLIINISPLIDWLMLDATSSAFCCVQFFNGRKPECPERTPTSVRETDKLSQLIAIERTCRLQDSNPKPQYWRTCGTVVRLLFFHLKDHSSTEPVSGSKI